MELIISSALDQRNENFRKTPINLRKKYIKTLYIKKEKSISFARYLS